MAFIEPGKPGTSRDLKSKMQSAGTFPELLSEELTKAHDGLSSWPEEDLTDIPALELANRERLMLKDEYFYVRPETECDWIPRHWRTSAPPASTAGGQQRLLCNQHSDVSSQLTGDYQ